MMCRRNSCILCSHEAVGCAAVGDYAGDLGVGDGGVGAGGDESGEIGSGAGDEDDDFLFPC